MSHLLSRWQKLSKNLSENKFGTLLVVLIILNQFTGIDELFGCLSSMGLATN